MDYKEADSLITICNPEPSIHEKCEEIKRLLSPHKKALIGSKLELEARFDQYDPADFSDHIMFLDHIGDVLLPICDDCRSYKFEVYIYMDGNIENIVSTILQFPPIIRCSNVTFKLHVCEADRPSLLPIEVISSWLNRSIDGSNFNSIKQKQAERFLQIDANRIWNTCEMIKELKKVRN